MRVSEPNDIADQTVSRTVAIAYPFFPHYRAAVLKELMECSPHRYTLIADTRDPESLGGEQVVAWKQLETSGGDRFIVTKCRRYPGGAVWQSGLVWQALRGSFDTIIYYGHAGFVSTWIAAVISRLRGKHVLMWTHGWTRHEEGLKRRVRDSFYRISHGLLLYGHVAKMIGIDHGFAPGRLHVIYNSLDVPEQLRLSATIMPDMQLVVRQRFDNPDRPLLITIGRLIDMKRLDLLITAARELGKRGLPVNVLIVGDGPARKALETQAAELGVSAVFTGACYDEALIATMLSAADVAVVPGDVGLTAMHAMIYGTPVVSHNRPWRQGPEWEAIVPGRTGALFKTGELDDLVAVLYDWLTNNPDRESVRTACVEMVQRLWNPQTQRLLIDAAVSRQSADDLLASRTFMATRSR